MIIIALWQFKTSRNFGNIRWITLVYLLKVHGIFLLKLFSSTKQRLEFVYTSVVVIRNFKGLTHHMHYMFVHIIFASSFVPQKSLKKMKTLNNHIHVKCAHDKLCNWKLILKKYCIWILSYRTYSTNQCHKCFTNDKN